MTGANKDRSRVAIHNLNRKVDQKRLAQENRLLRWLTVTFAVALALTFIFNLNDSTVLKNETDVQHLRDYSGTTEQRSASEPRIQRSSAFVNRGTPGQSWTF